MSELPSQVVSPPIERAESVLDRQVFTPVTAAMVPLLDATPVSAPWVMIFAAAIGAGGASLYRFTSPTNLIVGSVLLLLYAFMARAAAGLARERGADAYAIRMIEGAAGLVVWLALLGASVLHLLAEGDSIGLAVAGVVSVGVQAFVLDRIEQRFLARTGQTSSEREDLEALDAVLADPGGGPALAVQRGFRKVLAVEVALAGLFPAVPEEAATVTPYARRLGPIVQVFAHLGLTVHLALMAVLAVVGALSGYFWIRLTLGNALLLGLLFAYVRAERALAAELRGPLGLSGLR